MTTFETLVLKMRKAQRECYIKRDEATLKKAQTYEHHVDLMLNQKEKEDALLQSKALMIFDEYR
jgi:hypothetical protein